MAIRTYIDGGKQAITYYNDTEPCAVYVDGDLQENVSFVPDTVQGTGSVEYTSEYKKNHIEYEVQGTTIQDGIPTPEAPIPIENANDDGMSVILRGENLFNAQGGRSYEIHISEFSFGNNFIKKKNTRTASEDSIIFSKQYPSGTYTLSFKSIYSKEGWYSIRLMCTKAFTGGTYNSVYKAYYKDIASNTDPDVTYSFTVNDTFEIGFGFNTSSASGYGTMELYDIMLTPKSQAVEYKPYFEETIEIPTSIDVNGTNVPLLFSVYDKLTVDRVKSEVIYSQGSFTYSYTGEETGTSKLAITSGNGNNYRSYYGSLFNKLYNSVSCYSNTGYISHFKKGKWKPLSAYGTCAIRTTDIIFRTDGVQTLDEFKAFLQEQYANGTPVKFIIQRQTTIEHDITNTDLGQSLLNLDTQNQTNYFEITSNENAPQTPINFTFAKWGGRNENNNNT